MPSSMTIIPMAPCANLKWSNWTETIPKTNPRKLRTKPETYTTTDRVGISYNNGDRCHEM